MLNQLYQNILDCSYDFLCWSETWLYDGIYDGEICDNALYYDVCRCDVKLDANNSRGGRICILVKKSNNVKVSKVRMQQNHYEKY